jgi:hypothetical protein
MFIFEPDKVKRTNRKGQIGQKKYVALQVVLVDNQATFYYPSFNYFASAETCKAKMDAKDLTGNGSCDALTGRRSCKGDALTALGMSDAGLAELKAAFGSANGIKISGKFH